MAIPQDVVKEAAQGGHQAWVPDDVRYGEFGCRHCLFFGIECTSGSRYKAAKTYNGLPSCKGYAYYD